MGQLLDGGFDVLRFRFTKVATLAAVILAPFVAVPTIASHLTGARTGAYVWLGSDPVDPMVVPTTSALTQLLIGFVGPLLTLGAEMMMGVAMGHLVGSWLSGSDPTASQVLAVVRSRFGVAMGALGLALLAKMLGAAFCLVGLLYAVPVLSLMAPVIAVEGSGVTASFSRALALGRRRYGVLLAITLLWLLVSFCVTLGQQAAVKALTEQLPATAFTEVLSLAAAILTSTFLRVVSVSVTVLAYVDARVRTEGLDLAMALPRVFGSGAV